jgi:hypothetical protein
MRSAITPAFWQRLISTSPTRLRITSDSMCPLLQPGETIELGPLPAILIPGDILVYQRKQHLIVHRYLGCGYFQGDNSARADTLVPPEDIIGIAAGVIRDDLLQPIPRRFSPRACIRLFRLQVKRVLAVLRK